MTDDTATRFAGSARLYGQAALGHFLRARVAVVGVGGVGSWAVEALARAGIGHLSLIDPDEICLSNVNRQLHAMDGQVGRLKVAAMAERVRAIHPRATVAEHPVFFSPRNCGELLDPGFDLVIDAIDVLRHKCLLLVECHRRGIAAVTCGGAGGRTDPARVRVDDLARSAGDQLLLQVRRNLRTHHGFPKAATGKTAPKFGIEAVFSEEPRRYPDCRGGVSLERPAGLGTRLNCATGFGSCAAVTATFGMIAAARALDQLARQAAPAVAPAATVHEPA